MRVGELMTASFYTVSSIKSVTYAAELMERFKVGSLLVVDDGEIIGIVTSRDIRSAHPNRIVADASTKDIISVDKECFVWDALSMMERHEIERLAVTAEGKITGIITRETLRNKTSQLLDPLTNLYRVDYLEYVAGKLLRDKQKFHLIFIDFNQFGKVNKDYGHPFGNDLLKIFSRRLLDLKCEHDYFCRYGGDEFVIVTTRDETEMDKFLDLLTAPIHLNDICITLSAGVLNGYNEESWFEMSFRDMLVKVSLASTNNKKRQVS
ncbi:GGDEF domain-containing protein [Ferviditalea candida]|uniref:GGDEF domain-containing protein n=1 Tax=Ferviditalea candida TaxID=3108399 RepID=A0ABU5ZE25_9BACL|nr:GGDEF domain-containing protein [Paenibacillaceae bacterium T2]